MPLSLRASIPLAATVAIGCSAPVVDDVADANGSMTEGVVLVERTAAGDGSAKTYVSAKFMRLSTPADPDLAERVVGSKLDLPAAGTCVRARPDSVGRAQLSPGGIELFDVGDVTLRAGAASMPLAARAFPDVGDLVSGMFYTSRDSDGDMQSDLPVGGTYTLEGTGSAYVERFAIEADAPVAPEDVRVGEAPLGDPASALAAGPAVVRWRAVEAPPVQGQIDLVLVDVSAASGASVRCAYHDAGRAVLPGWILTPSLLGPLPASATVAVHRIRERSFVAPGLDAGEVRFDLSVVGRVIVARGATRGVSGASIRP